MIRIRLRVNVHWCVYLVMKKDRWRSASLLMPEVATWCHRRKNIRHGWTIVRQPLMHLPPHYQTAEMDICFKDPDDAERFRSRWL